MSTQRETAPRRGDEVEVAVDRLAYGGKGVGRAGRFVVFVALSAPGDRLRARITRTRRRHGEAEIAEILEPSKDRVEPPCPYFGQCGGCAWQHVDGAAQLKAKEAIVRESFERLGELPADLPYRPIIPSPDAYGYRNKMEFSFHPDAVLGLHLRGFFDRVLEIDACLLASDAGSAILRDVKAFVLEHHLPRWDTRSHAGLMRHLVFREGRGTGEIMVGLVTTSDPFPQAADLARRLAEKHPQITSIVRAVTDAQADVVQADRLEILHGRDHIFESLGGLRFRVDLQTFFQTNTAQAEKMVEIVLELAELKGHETVVDLFCGVGTFALLLAPHVRRVFGLEVVEPSIEAARVTAAREGIENAEFVVGDARRGLPGLMASIGDPPDLLVLDPPRSGAGGKVMRKIGRARPQRVIYVSCNPTTLAPDLAWLVRDFGYRITAVQPLDLFPQTHHVETIVRLDLEPVSPVA